MFAGIAGGLGPIFGLLFATGDLLLGSTAAVVKFGVAAAGAWAVRWSLKRIAERQGLPPDSA